MPVGDQINVFYLVPRIYLGAIGIFGVDREYTPDCCPPKLSSPVLHYHLRKSP